MDSIYSGRCRKLQVQFREARAGPYKGQRGGTAARQAALGVDEGSMNWICAPPDLDVRWAPMAARKREILAEDAEIAELVNTEQRQ